MFSQTVIVYSHEIRKGKHHITTGCGLDYDAQKCHMDMKFWCDELINTSIKKPMPLLSFPAIQLIDEDIDDLVRSGAVQAKCLRALIDRYGDMLAAVLFMDLSVEAEAFGSPVAFSDDEVPAVTERIIETNDDIDALRVPEVGDARTGEYVKAVVETKKLIDDRPVFAGAIGPFTLAGRLMDMTEIMIRSMTEPESVAAVLEKATAFLIAYIEAFKQAGADGVIIAEPAAGLLSPTLNSDFSVSYNKQIVDAVQDDSFIVIYHNCGNVIPLMDDILTIGARALHFGNNISMADIMATIPPDVLVMGNIDPAGELRHGTPDSIRTTTTALLKACASYKNFVLSSGCDIPLQAPLDNIDAFFKAWAAFYA